MPATPRARWILSAAITVAVLNLWAFVAGAFFLGGEALNGRVDDGRYYLSNLSDGGPTVEVSHAVWVYSYVHGVSVIGSHAALVLAIPVLWLTGDLRPGRTASP
jgi:hypothetical protein